MYSLEDLLHISTRQEVWIMGGAEIYKLFLPYTIRLLVTHVNVSINDSDTFFPKVDKNWQIHRQLFQQEADEKNDFSFSVTEYRKK